MRVQFDRFYTYAELTETLEAWASGASHAVRLRADRAVVRGARHLALHGHERGDRAGRGEARGLPCTRRSTRWSSRGRRRRSTSSTTSSTPKRRARPHAVDTRTFYVVPRVNPDGAEAGLADGRFRRSSVRPVSARRARGRPPPRGRQTATGACSSCACQDPNGSWKPHPDDAPAPDRPPSRTTRRGRLLPRPSRRDDPQLGRREHPDRASALEGLDLNRNWPADWAPEAEQPGAGPFPTSEPEVRALVEAIVARKNITSYIRYHTFSGVHLRPWSGHSDDDFPVPDLRAFKLIGRGGDAPHRLSGDLDLPRLQVPPEDGHQGRRRRLDLRPPRRIRLGDRSSGARSARPVSPEYHFIDWLREHLRRGRARRAEGRGRARRGATSTGTRSSHPQLGPVEARRLGSSSASGSTRRSRDSRRR